MKPLLKEKQWHELFEVGLFLKAFNGAWETVSGLMFLLVSKATLSGWFSRLIQNELLEDPRDRVTNFIVHTLLNPGTTTKTFAALYVLFHGLLNLFLVIQLRRDKHWAYLVTIWTVILFMFYQVYRISVHHSLILTVITIFDVFYIFIVWHEYRHHVERKNRIPQPPTQSSDVR